MEKINTEKLPPFVSYVTETLEQRGFEAYMVGGCVRDLLMGKVPKDWDITTNAKPEQVTEVFNNLKTVAENDFGTVTILNMPKEEGDRVSNETPDQNNQVQVTTFRSEGKYDDFRHPGTVTYETKLEKDLERRDFTMNAIALDHKGQIKDIFEGQKDIKDKIIKTVGNAGERFQEDALRMLRAIRFSCQLGFAVSHETLEAIHKNASLLSHVSGERIRDELLKIVDSDTPAIGFDLLQKTGLLTFIAPDFNDGVGCEQKGEHVYDVFNHLLHALQHAADKKFSTEVRLAALFHDIGKPATRRFAPEKNKYTFFGHEVVGAKMTKKILDRLRFSRETVSRVTSLVRNHMFFSDTEQITLSAVRRIIKNVGPENIWYLMEVRECDRVGMKKKETSHRIRKYHSMIEEALRDPISVSQLAINGNYLIEVLRMKPGPRMGWMLHALLEEVLDDPTLNTIEKLTERLKEFEGLDDATLKALGEKGKEKKDIANEEEVGELRKKHGVK